MIKRERERDHTTKQKNKEQFRGSAFIKSCIQELTHGTIKIILIFSEMSPNAQGLPTVPTSLYRHTGKNKLITYRLLGDELKPQHVPSSQSSEEGHNLPLYFLLCYRTVQMFKPAPGPGVVILLLCTYRSRADSQKIIFQVIITPDLDYICPIEGIIGRLEVKKKRDASVLLPLSYQQKSWQQSSMLLFSKGLIASQPLSCLQDRQVSLWTTGNLVQNFMDDIPRANVCQGFFVGDSRAVHIPQSSSYQPWCPIRVFKGLENCQCQRSTPIQFG